MFDKLDDMLIHYEELMLMLGDPDVTQDTKRFTRLMKEQADLAPIVEAYKQYKQAKQDVEDSLALLEEENDEEMREMAKEELSGAFSKLLPWSIAKGQLGDPLKWDIIYQRNSGSVKNPDLIYEGQILDIPKG